MSSELLVEDYRKLITVTKSISCSLDLEEQLPCIMDAALALTQADKCMVVLFNAQGQLEVRAERFAEGVKQDSGKYSRSVIQDVVDKGEPVFVLDTDLHGPSKARQSIQNFQLRTVMCTPLRSRTGLLGALYVHASVPTRAFNEAKKEIFMALSDHAAIALDNAQLYAASISDPMTGLYNHSYCIRRLDEEISRANRYGRYLSFVLVDIDNFKTVNDTFGHRAGDKLLRGVAEAIRQSVRRVDIPVRYGGDEFAVILPDTGGPQDVVDGSTTGPKVLGERIRASIEALSRELSYQTTASVGIATYPSDGSKEGQSMDLIERADIAMYSAKRSGGNSVAQHAPASHVE